MFETFNDYESFTDDKGKNTSTLTNWLRAYLKARELSVPQLTMKTLKKFYNSTLA